MMNDDGDDDDSLLCSQHVSYDSLVASMLDYP